MNDWDLRYLRAVVAVADTRHFGRAAARLHLSQPPLTRMVAEAERIVGVKLFTRTTRQVALTAIGEVFVAEARAILDRVAEAERVIAAAKRRAAGALCITYTPLALRAILPSLLSALRAEYHDVSVDLLEAFGEEYGDALARGKADMVFGNAPAPEADSVLLARDPLSVLLPAGHPLSTLESLSFKELAQIPLILHERHEYPSYYARVLSVFMKNGATPNIYHRAAGQNCKALVVAGMGALLVPSWTATEAGLSLVPLAADLHTEMWASWRNTLEDTAEKRSLIALVRKAEVYKLGNEGALMIRQA